MESNNAVIDNSLIENLVELPYSEEDPGFIGNIMNSFNDNRIYIYMLVVVLIIGVIVYYLYKKYKSPKETMNNTENKNKSNNEQIITKLVSGDFFVLNEYGQAVKIKDVLKPMLPVNQNMVQMEEVPKQQPIQQVMKRPKLEHPGESNEMDINEEIMRMQKNEDENVAQLNLTHSELADINTKFQEMEHS
jgi:flagellar biogenesis protein FliO